ncbi:MAG: ABC transporter substrate-binding protein [Treponema sp.]|nr:ABC transporter substrate-binding protein [Treponema sp.]
MKKFTKIIAVLSVFFALAAAEAKSKKVVRIGSANGGGSREFQGILAVGKELKLFEDEFGKLGYDVEYITLENGVAVNEAILSSELEFAFIGDVPGFVGLSNNIGSVWIGEDLGFSTLGIAVPKDFNLTGAKDLIGKTVSVNIGTNAHLLYAKYFEDGGVSADQFTTANLTLANGTASLVGGKVDAVFGDITAFYPLAKKGEIKLAFTTLERPEWHSQLLLLGHKKFLKKNPNIGVAFFRAVIRARQEALKAPEKFYGQISASALKDYPEFAAKLYNSDGKLTPLISKITLDQIERAQGLVDYFQSIKRINGKHDVKKFIDTSFYEKAAKELGIQE